MLRSTIFGAVFLSAALGYAAGSRGAERTVTESSRCIPVAANVL